MDLHPVWTLTGTTVHPLSVCQTSWPSWQPNLLLGSKTCDSSAHHISFINFVRWPQVLSSYLQNLSKCWRGKWWKGMENDQSVFMWTVTTFFSLVKWYSPHRCLRATQYSKITHLKLDIYILNTAEALLALPTALTGDFTACPRALAITTV